MNERRYMRRDVLVSSGTAAILSLTGCLGGASSGARTNSISYNSIKAWRNDVKKYAKEELKDEKLTFWARNPGAKQVLSQVLNGKPPKNSDHFSSGPIIEDGSPWEPLKGNVEVAALSPSKQATKYQRQAQTGTVKVDVLTGDIAKQIKQGAPFMDLSKMPAWKKYIPKRLREVTSKEAFFSASTLAIVYNQKTVSEPPENLLDLLDERFSENLIVDATPPLFLPWTFMQRYGDSVPPHLKAIGSDKTGNEFIDAIDKQKPTITRSSYKASIEVGKGSVDASFFTPIPIMYSLQAEGLPVAPVDHPSSFLMAPDGLGVPKNPPHPNAAKLLVDFVLSHPKVKTCRPGWITPNLSHSNPPHLKEMVAADWRNIQPALKIDNMAKMGDLWRKQFDVPSV